jgi:hypothetical protein
LRSAVLENFEVGLLQVPDWHSLLVADDDIHQDGGDTGFLRTGGALRRLLLVRVRYGYGGHVAAQRRSEDDGRAEEQKQSVRADHRSHSQDQGSGIRD